LRYAANRRGRGEVAGRVVERLDRQWHRLLAAAQAHPGIGNTGAHLHQAVEAATPRPWSRPAIGTQTEVDQARRQRPARCRAVAEAVERVGTVAVQDDVGFGEQRLERGASTRVLEVEPRAALAERHLGNDTGLVPAGRIDA